MARELIMEILPVVHSPKEYFLTLRNLSVKDVTWDGMALLREKTEPSPANFVSLAFLAYLKTLHPSFTTADWRTMLAQSVHNTSVMIKLNEILDKFQQEIAVFSQKWSREKLLAAIVSDFSWYAKSEGRRQGLVVTPHPFAYLANCLLHINKGDTVLDYCSGVAEFMLDTFFHTEASKIYGSEISTDAVITSKIRTSLVGDIFDIRQGNSLNTEISADKVFADPPLGVKFDRSLEKWQPQDANLIGAYEDIPRTRRMDWAFVLSALAKQNNGGRTVILTYDGLLFRASKGEQEMRRYLVESGRLEAVIALPQGIIPTTNILFDLLVLSQDNTCVKMVDARDCRVKERFASEMTQENLEEVLRRVNEETDFSRVISHEEIANREYALSPISYMAASIIKMENGVTLGNLSISLGRGQVAPAARLEELATKKETRFQHLMLRDIENDSIRSPLPYLTEIPRTWERFCVKTGNLVISRSAPIKIAIVPELHEKKVLATGNLYFLELDEMRVNPIYVLCYLKSREGIRQIESLSRGSSAPILSIRDLQQIQIPMIPMEKQTAIAAEYTSLRRQLESLKRQEHALEGQIALLIEEVL